MFKLIPDFDAVSVKGFHMTFENGWTVSVQIGAGNYCDNYSKHFGTPVNQSKTAEVWAWDVNGAYFEPDVRAYLSMNEVLEYANRVAAMPKVEKNTVESASNLDNDDSLLGAYCASADTEDFDL